jgi:competence protein ComEC
MNVQVEKINLVSFSVWEGIHISEAQALLLYAIIAAAYYWMDSGKKKAVFLLLILAGLYVCLRSASFIRCEQQKKIIVYNIPKMSAVDIISGHYCYYIGSQEVVQNEQLKNFHIRPGRIGMRIIKCEVLDVTMIRAGSFSMYIAGKDSLPIPKKITRIDLLIISGKEPFSISVASMQCKIGQVGS